MRAKQLIYTSWKNGSSTKKGFMVYSASEGISAEDTEAIVNLMRYTTLPSLPFVPTWEQIEEMFPRDAAYFKLPSGNYCLAQSSYLGKDYSGRLNNYIIHAFVLDREPDFNPLSVIHTDFFRRFLTEEELNAESNPPPLPEVELSQPRSQISVEKLKEYFTTERLEILEYLLCAVTEGAKTGQPVYLYDDYQTLIYWFEALRYCLPEGFKPTFTTYASIRSNAWSIQSVKPGSLLNYRMEWQAKRFVYDIKNKYIHRDVPIGAYSRYIVRAFAEDPCSVQQKAANIDAYRTEADGNMDTAVLLSDFYAKKASAFSDPQAFATAFGCAKKSGRLTATQLVETVYAIIGKNPSYTFATAREAFGYVAEHGDAALRNRIISDYLQEAERLHAGEPPRSTASAVQETIDNSPFDWQLFVEYAEKKYGLDGYFSLYQGNAFMTDLMIKSLATYGSERQIASLKKVLLVALRKQDITAVMDVISPLQKRGALRGVVNEVFRTEMNECNGGFLAQGSPTFALSVLKEVRDSTDELTVLAHLIRYHARTQGFADQLERYLSAYGITEEAILAKAGNDPSVTELFDSLGVKRFLKNVPTRASITDFYEKFYQSGKDRNGVLEQMLEKFLNVQFGEERIRAALEWKGFFDRAGERNPRIYDLLARYALGSDFNITYDLIRKDRRIAKQLDEFAAVSNKSEGGTYAAVCLADLLKRAVKENKAYEELMSRVQFGVFAQLEPATVTALAEVSFAEAFKVYGESLNGKKRDCDLIAESVLGAFGEANGRFITKTAEELKRLPVKKVTEYLLPFALSAVRNGDETCVCAKVLSEYFALEKNPEQILDKMCSEKDSGLSDWDKKFLSGLLPPKKKKSLFRFW